MSEDLKLHSLNYDEKGLEMSLSGEPAKVFLQMLIGLFEQNGGKNFLTMAVHNNSKKYEITIVNQNGNDTPSEKIGRYQDALEKIAGRTMSQYLSTEDMATDFKRIAIDVLKEGE